MKTLVLTLALAGCGNYDSLSKAIGDNTKCGTTRASGKCSDIQDSTSTDTTTATTTDGSQSVAISKPPEPPTLVFGTWVTDCTQGIQYQETFSDATPTREGIQTVLTMVYDQSCTTLQSSYTQKTAYYQADDFTFIDKNTMKSMGLVFRRYPAIQ